MNETEYSLYSEDELKAIHECLTREHKGFIQVKKKTTQIPDKLALEVVMDDYQKEFTDLVKSITKK